MTISRPGSGSIVYTTDGSEPDGSTTASTVTTQSVEVTLGETTHLKARINDNGTWGPLTDAVYRGVEDRSQLRISEIHYHPYFDSGTYSADPSSGRKEHVNGGLRVFRFDGTSTSARDALQAIEVDDTVDFSWGANESPHADLGSDSFSQMWEGWLVPRSAGDHRLVLEMEGDSAWLRIDGFPAIDGNGDPILGTKDVPLPIIEITEAGSTTETTRALHLEAGTRYRIMIDYQRLGGSGHIRLKWIEPSASNATLIPISCLRVDDTGSEDYAFIELHNAGDHAIDLSGWFFNRGITYTFPDYTVLGGDERLVLAANPRALRRRHPGVVIHGAYAGSLSNGGERLVLCDADRSAVIDLTYDDANGWPRGADGVGASLVYTGGTIGDPSSWAASKQMDGSPGAVDEAASDGAVLITEALTHTDEPFLDTVELHNPSDGFVDIGGWWLSDDRQDPQKWQIPVGTAIAPGGYLTFDEDDFGTAFALSSRGEEIYIFGADSAGVLDGYAHGFSFGAAANGVTFGRYVISTGDEHFVAQSAPSLGAANSGPAVGPVVISEIMYHPIDGEPEWIELANITNAAVSLYDDTHDNGWRMEGASYAFPSGAVVPARGVALLVAEAPADFRSRYSIPAAVPIYGPFDGKLSNGGEDLELQRPDTPEEVDGTETVPRIVVDRVDYDDAGAWPTAPDGDGPSLERIDVTAYGDDPANWQASGAHGGNPGSVTMPPLRQISLSVGDAGGLLDTEIKASQAGNVIYQDEVDEHVIEDLMRTLDTVIEFLDSPASNG